jgi:hypothetical protein
MHWVISLTECEHLQHTSVSSHWNNTNKVIYPNSSMLNLLKLRESEKLETRPASRAALRQLTPFQQAVSRNTNKGESRNEDDWSICDCCPISKCSLPVVSVMYLSMSLRWPCGCGCCKGCYVRSSTRIRPCLLLSEWIVLISVLLRTLNTCDFLHPSRVSCPWRGIIVTAARK